MRLSEYSDDELIEEIKHRGLKVTAVLEAVKVNKIIIGGVTFDFRT